MQDNTIIEGNKLIAEFMGWTAFKFKGYKNPIYHNGKGSKKLEFELRYNSRWDELMPVVEKIENLWNPLTGNCIYDEQEGSEFNINALHVDLDTAGYKNGVRLEFRYTEYWELKNKSEALKKQHVWIACVQFIQWYNTLSKDTNQ